MLVDAFLVRMTLVPAAMALAGKAAWWLPNWLDRLLPNVDVEGEGLRAHLDDLAWARQQKSALTAEGAYLGIPAQAMGPLNFAIDAGAVVTVQGDAAARRVFAASLAGRLDPVAGRLQLLGSPLPSERSRALRRVGLIDVGAGQRHDLDRTVGEVLAERLELSQPWYRGRFGGGAERAWIDRINAALRATGTSLRPIDAETEHLLAQRARPRHRARGERAHRAAGGAHRRSRRRAARRCPRPQHRPGAGDAGTGRHDDRVGSRRRRERGIRGPHRRQGEHGDRAARARGRPDKQ